MLVITGANGFIGANLLEAVARGRGLPAVAVDDLPSLRDRAQPQPTAPAEARYPDTAAHDTAWLDKDRLRAWLDDAGDAVAGVLHLGACSDTTVTDRDYVMATNDAYTRSLWRWATRHDRPLVYASSAATYGDGSAGFDDEADPHRYRPMNLYGESKHRFDLWALERAAAGEAPPRWAGLKYFNVYGPRESHKGRMASMAYHWFGQVAATGEARLFRSYRQGVEDGAQQRDFIYVADAVAAMLHLFDAPVSESAPNGLYNVGTGRPRTFADLARAVFAAMGREPRLVYIEMPEDLRGQYQYYTCATTAKLRRAGFTRPFTTLEDGVRRYVQYLEQAEAVHGRAD